MNIGSGVCSMAIETSSSPAGDEAPAAGARAAALRSAVMDAETLVSGGVGSAACVSCVGRVCTGGWPSALAAAGERAYSIGLPIGLSGAAQPAPSSKSPIDDEMRHAWAVCVVVVFIRCGGVGGLLLAWLQ